MRLNPYQWMWMEKTKSVAKIVRLAKHPDYAQNPTLRLKACNRLPRKEP
jgi:hypothetical protein